MPEEPSMVSTVARFQIEQILRDVSEKG